MSAMEWDHTYMIVWSLFYKYVKYPYFIYDLCFTKNTEIF